MLNERNIFTSLKYKIIPFTLIVLLVTMYAGMFVYAGDINSELPSVQHNSMTLMSNIYDATCIALTPGRNATELNFAWYSPKGYDRCAVQFAKKSDMEGEIFPVAAATTYTGTVSDEPESNNSNYATITGLEEDTEYIYRLGDGNDESWSLIYYYTTRKTDGYNFIFYGDPQIGASGDREKDYEGWNDTLEKSLNRFPDTSFGISAGDQIETKDAEIQYRRYFKPQLMTSLPIQPVKDNHDDHLLYKYHFNCANDSKEYGVTNGTGNSYFTYGNTLFLILNMMNSTPERIANEQRPFMEMAIAAEPDVKWKVLVFHRGPYSAGPHYNNTYYREWLVPVIDYFDIDVVLNGHDHVFVRSHQMLGNEPQILGPQNPDGEPLIENYLNENGAAVNPKGTLYLTANSSSGSKYYDLMEEELEYVAVKSQLRVPTFTNISVTDSYFDLSTYRTDTMERVDQYMIIKGYSDEDCVPRAKDLLTFDVLSDEDINSVSKNLTLPTKWHETVVSWETSNPDIISADGKVSYMIKEDTTVTLTATITKGSISATKEFVVTVLKRLGNSGISIEVDNQTKNVKVEGNYQFTGIENISIMVKDAQDEIKYFDQIRRYDDEEDFQFVFRMNQGNIDGDYTVKIGAQGREYAYETEVYLSTDPNKIYIQNVDILNDENRESVTRLTPSEIININVKMVNNKDETIQLSPIVAIYDANDRLVKISVEKSEAIEGGKSKNLMLDFELPENVEGHYIKLFSWNNLDEMKPEVKMESFYK
jgi:hypothetical protein